METVPLGKSRSDSVGEVDLEKLSKVLERSEG